MTSSAGMDSKFCQLLSDCHSTTTLSSDMTVDGLSGQTSTSFQDRYGNFGCSGQRSRDRESGGQRCVGMRSGNRMTTTAKLRERSQSPVLRDVRQLSQVVDKQSIAKSAELLGKEGEEVALIVNQFVVKYEEIRCFRYDIEFRLYRRDGRGFEESMRKGFKLDMDQKCDHMMALEAMAANCPQVFKDVVCVTDGHKTLYCNRRLDISADEFISDITVSLNGRPQQTFHVRIQYSRQLATDFLFSEGMAANLSRDLFRDEVWFIDCTLRYQLMKSRVPVGRNIYLKTNRQPIEGQCVEIGFGYNQSTQMTECGPTIEIDRALSLFRCDDSLLEYIQRELGVTDIRGVVFSPQLVRDLSRKIKKLRVYTLNAASERVGHIVYGMDRELSGYRSRFGYGNVPPIEVYGSLQRRLSVEDCHILPNQAFPRHLTTSAMQKDIGVLANSQSPIKRFDKIVESVGDIVKESETLMSAFGLSLSSKPIKLVGRVLPAPTVKGEERQTEDGIQLNNYLFINLSDKVAKNLETNVQHFWKGLVDTAKGMGINISAQPNGMPVRVAADITYDGIEKVFIESVKDDTQMIFVCLQEGNGIFPEPKGVFEMIKHFGDNCYGIPTQCIRDDNLLDIKSDYFTNILHKISAKLEDKNRVLDPTVRQLFPKNVMIVGIDVLHPGLNPLANRKVYSSIAAVVGSYDPEFTKFSVNVSAQPKDTDIIVNIEAMFGKLLDQYFQRNGCYPESVILYYDGVTDIQLQLVIDRELPSIRKAFTARGVPFAPKLTVIVVRERIKTRFLPMGEELDLKGRMITTGTVVDHTIVRPVFNEFLLFSLLGTSRPTKYIVLWDDNQLSADCLQKMTYYLCYVHYRCKTPIAVPIAIKYADFAAFLAKQHISDINVKFERQNNSESDEERQERESRSVDEFSDGLTVDPRNGFIPYHS